MPMTKLTFLAAGLLMLAGPAAAAPGDTAAPQTNRGIMRFDTNHDGFVDRAEWTAGQEARFRQLYSDRDGKLSRDELFARTPASDGGAVPNERQVQRQNAYF